MKSRVVGLLALSALVAPAAGETPRRFAAPDANVLQLCHRIHMLPAGSFEHARALKVCLDLHAAIPKKYQDGPSQQKIDYGAVLEAEKAKKITKAQDRVPTPEELAGLKALEDSQAKLKNVKDEIATNNAAREADAVKAEQQAAQDLALHEQQYHKQMEDNAKTLQNEQDKSDAANAHRQDQFDADSVDKAKAQWAETEKSIASAKASAAADAKIVEGYSAKIADVKAQHERDMAQKKADMEEAAKDKDLADDADKATRAKAREDRAEEMEARAKEREQTMEQARAERDAALERQRLVEEEAKIRTKHQQEIDDTEAALAANRKRRQEEELERQKRMDDYANEEAEIKKRREEYEKAKKEREARLKKREEEEEMRRKAKEEDDARLAKTREDEAPREERPKQDNEEECKDKSTSCGSGKCFQLKSDPKSKRCQCQKGDKGKNCEHAACEYDIDDGAGKTRSNRATRSTTSACDGRPNTGVSVTSRGDSMSSVSRKKP